MKSRLVLAAFVLLGGLFGLFFALGSDARQVAERTSPDRAVGALPATLKSVAAVERFEQRSYVKRAAKKGHVKARGWVEAIHLGDKGDGPEWGYDLHAGGRVLVLDLGEDAANGDSPAIASNTEVKVTGRRFGNTVISSRILPGATAPAPGLQPSQTVRAAQTRTIAVLRVNYIDDTSQPISQADLEPALSTDVRSAKAYYQRVSTNGLTLAPTFFPYLTLSIKRPTAAECASPHVVSSTIADAVPRAADEAGIDLRPFDHIAYVFKAGNGSCGAASAGTDSRNSYYPYIPPASTFAHELGHNLGLEHANRLACDARGATASISTRCARAEYGDLSDVMGSSYRQLNAYHLATLGFLPLENVQKVSAVTGQTIQLFPAEQRLSAGTKQLLSVRRTNAAPDSGDAFGFLHVDLRRPDGLFDNFDPADRLVKGVQLRLGPDVQYPGHGEMAGFLVNPTPGRSIAGNSRPIAVSSTTGAAGSVAPAQDFALQAGQSYWDPQENVTVTLVSVAADGSSANVKLTNGGPALSSSPAPAATTAAVVSGQLRVTAGAGRVNAVVLSKDGDRVVVTDFGNTVTPGAGCELLDAQAVSCSSGVTSARVELGDLDDTGSVSDGRTGKGIATAELSLPVTFLGGAGNDLLEGGIGDDVFNEETAANGSDLFRGNEGTDTVSYANRTAKVTLKGTNASERTEGQDNERDRIDGDIENLTGGEGPDIIAPEQSVAHTLIGNGGADTFTGNSGAERIEARDGVADTSIVCGGGTDVLIRDQADVPGSGCEPSGFAPQIVVDGPAEGSYIKPSKPAFLFTAPFSAGVTYECKLEWLPDPGTAAFAPCTSPWVSPNSLNTGAWSFSARAIVSGAQAGTIAVRRFNVDSSTPNTTIDALPAATTQGDAVVAFSSTATDSPTFECALDSGQYIACVSPKTYKDLAPGAHSIAVRAVDRASNADATPATGSWTNAVDTVIDRTPSSYIEQTVASDRPAVFFHANGVGATFTCQWGAEPAYPCTSGSKPATRPTSSTFQVWATIGGVADPTPATQEIQPDSWSAIDISPIQSTGTVRWTNDTQPLVTFRAMNMTRLTFECRVDADAWAPCDSPYKPRVLGAPVSTVWVRGTNELGVVTAPVSLEWHRDVMPPDTVVTQEPVVNGSTADIGFRDPDFDPANAADCRSNDLTACSTFECKIDAGHWTQCPTPFTTPTLTGGAHTLKVRSIDPAGNEDATPASRSIWVGPPANYISIAPPIATPTEEPLSFDGEELVNALDFIHWRGVLPTDFERKNVPQRIGTWSGIHTGSPFMVTGPTAFTWFGAAGTPTSGTSSVGVAKGAANGRGLRFAVPANGTETRKLRVYVGVRGAGTTIALKAYFNGQAGTVTQVSSTSNTVIANKTFDITYRPLAATDTLNIDWWQGGGGTNGANAAILYGAALY